MYENFDRLIQFANLLEAQNHLGHYQTNLNNI
jgi:hypothetical protein